MSRKNPPPAKREPFKAVDITVANGNCANGNRPTGIGTSCPACQNRVILHCGDCKLQVTACLCSEYERFGQDAAWQRAVARWGEEAARQRAEMAGLWVPGQ